MSVVVQPLVQNGMLGLGIFRKREDQRAEHGQRHRADQDDEGVAETVELGRQHQEDQDDRQRERGKEFVALGRSWNRDSPV